MKLVKNVQNQKGFTLVELIVVIAILGILAAIAMPRFTNQTVKANTAKIASDLGSIDTAIVLAEADGVISNTTALADVKGLLINNPANSLNTQYLTTWPTAPTGTAYYLPAGGTRTEPTVTGGTYGIEGSSGNFRAIFTPTATGSTATHAEDWHQQ